MRALRMIGYAAALTALIATSVQAQESAARTKLTYVTFSAPVEVPNATLPAGKYMFKMADTLGGSHAVQIFSADGKKLFTTFLAVPDQKPSSDTPTSTVVMFRERAAGSPQAVRVWFAANNPAGEEFVYPRKQAVRIAQANRMPVLSSPDGTNSSSAKIARVDETGQIEGSSDQDQPAAANQVARNQEPERAVPPAGDRVGTAGQDNAVRRTLPRTASNLSTMELVSGLLLVGAIGIRRVRLSTAMNA